MKEWNPWTAPERAILSAHYASGTKEELLTKLPGRTWLAIRVQARKVGAERMARWTPAEDQLLRQQYPVSTEAQLRALLPSRPWNSITQRAQRLGVFGARRWTPDQLATMHAFYPTHGSAYVARLLGRSDYSVMKRATVLGLFRVRPEKPAPAPAPKLPKPPKEAKAPKAPKPPKVAKVKGAPKPKPAPVVKPQPEPRVAVKRAPRTPILNAAKEARLQQEQAVKKAVLVTADDIRKLPYNHPGRMAYTLHGQAGWQRWQQQATTGT